MSGGREVQQTADPFLLDAAEVARSLGTDVVRGLSSAEAAERLESAGPNTLREAAPVPAWRRFVRQFRDPLVVLLLVAILISTAAWFLEGAVGLPYDALVIAVILTLNAVLGFAQEARAETAVAALRRLTASTATVVRDGRTARVPTAEVVVGDLLVLGEGDLVAADARLVDAATLSISEASLTGESEPVPKGPSVLAGAVTLADRTNMVFSGTAVVRGVGRAVVTSTGMDTQVGQIADLLDQARSDPTPLQREIARVGLMLGSAVVLIAAVVIGTVFATYGVGTTEHVVNTLLLGVSLAVAAVPEGLPAVLSVVLALGVQRMAEHHAIVKRLASVETLGSASVICTDKTGTLTQGEMSVAVVLTPIGELTLTGVGSRPSGAGRHAWADLGPASPLVRQGALVIDAGSCANDAELRGSGEEWTVHGDPTEAAFLIAERTLGDHDCWLEALTRVGEVPFTSERRMMSVLATDPRSAGQLVVLSKGAADVLVHRCTRIQVGDEVVALDDRGRADLLAEADRLADDALRTLAVAYRRLEVSVPPADLESVESDLVYLGLVGIADPPREEAGAAIQEARAAGVRIVMITGDHPRTARRIARELRLAEDDTPAVSGVELDALDDTAWDDVVRRSSVFARVTPRHKLRIVDALRSNGHVVAMTGDGVNDAPALKSADIGIAMGRTGTEVTKEAADMVLADDNFATIVRAVREGRGIYANIRKFLRYLLSSNIGEVLTVFLGVVLASTLGLAERGELVLPLLATQILWINLLTDSAPALAMGVDAETDEVMQQPPRSVDARLIDARMWVGVLQTGLVMAVTTLLTMDLLLPGGLLEGTRELDTARTAGFTVLVLAQLVNAFCARSETRSAGLRAFSNRWLWAAVALALVLQVAVVHLPVLNRAFQTAPLTAGQWLLCVVMASLVLWFSELRKAILRALDRR